MKLVTKTFPDGDFPCIGYSEWVPSLMDKIAHFLLPVGVLLTVSYLLLIFFEVADK